jgi:hypothetical protein
MSSCLLDHAFSDTYVSFAFNGVLILEVSFCSTIVGTYSHVFEGAYVLAESCHR